MPAYAFFTIYQIRNSLCDRHLLPRTTLVLTQRLRDTADLLIGTWGLKGQGLTDDEWLWEHVGDEKEGGRQYVLSLAEAIIKEELPHGNVYVAMKVGEDTWVIELIT